MRDRETLMNEIRIGLPEVAAYQKKKGYDNFDFSYDYSKNTWQCLFFDKDDNIVEEFNGTDSWEVIYKLIK